MNTNVLLSLGSNVNNPRVQLQSAVSKLQELPETTLIAQSGLYQTPPWGNTNQPDFINMAVLISTALNVVELMQNILRIENEMGRVRFEKWGPRVIDIDIALFGESVQNDEVVTVPHLFMHERRFVLEPSAEIAGTMIHPVLKQTISELLVNCTDSSVVLRLV